MGLSRGLCMYDVSLVGVCTSKPPPLCSPLLECVCLCRRGEGATEEEGMAISPVCVCLCGFVCVFEGD